MACIYLYFGKPYDSWAKEMAEEIAINHNVTMEKAVFKMIQRLLEAFADTTDGYSFLDDRFGWTYKRLVRAPKITLKQVMQNGVTYSAMVLSEEFVTHKVTGDRLPLTSKSITLFGEDFENMFGIEYLGHDRES